MALNPSAAHVSDRLTRSEPVIARRTTIAAAHRLLRGHGVPALPAQTVRLGVVVDGPQAVSADNVHEETVICAPRRTQDQWGCRT